MKNHYSGLLPKAHLWTDVFLLNLSFIIAYLLRFEISSRVLPHHYVNLLLVANLVWIFTIHILKTYYFTRLSYHFNTQLGNFLKAVLVHGAAMMAFLYLTKQGEEYSRYQFLVTYGLFVIMSTASRATAVLFLKLYRQAGYNYNRYAIVGKGDLATLIREFYGERKELGYRFYGMFSLENMDDQIVDLETLVKEKQLDYLYCCLSEMSDDQVRDVIKMGERQRTQIRLVPDFRGFMTNMATIEYHDMYPIIQVNTKPFSSFNEQTLKRTFDLVFSVIVMVLGAPIFFLVWAAIKISSPGPVFFKQQRSGRWGEMFFIYKFRSMYVDADKMGLQHSQGDGDPRITPIGRMLRKSRLDELPQFINVLKGEMSVVGPRPLYKYDVDMLMEAAPHEFQRLLTVKPGITSIGQINVGYADTVAKNVERLRYDLQYLKTYSVFDDVQLIFRTVQVMVLGRGQ
ncbi:MULTISPECIES: sugar transferase [Dyadobacter]|uniref:Sugar transferase n=1 Tax=Dyadobacter chenhuakuii TaxID=2909339 RepID=A0A9X1TW92_9BACT|nr:MULTISPECIES: sugar transferase [Dyadobacter]MCF2487351.1 sugar transferase [Dyadobacter sp. CY347]MCF2494181.1 sugar transferase [Dyadobacter chenhuakuii]MCF2501188.1 sugar transferase [Dyadobacter chenhuakuii]USJ31309.1 sugar transferase [Dyadobacter chenhuakuii]